MYCDFVNTKTIDALVAKKKLLQKQLLNGKKYVDPNDDPTTYTDLNKQYHTIQCLKDNLENAADVEQILCLTTDFLETLKTININIQDKYETILSDPTDTTILNSKMLDIKETTSEFHNTVKQVRFSCLDIFDETGNKKSLKWNFDCYCSSVEALEWVRPMIIDRSTPSIKTENRPKVHFYRNSDTLELYKEPNFNNVTGQLTGFPSNNEDLESCIENNLAVVKQDYQKLVNHSNNVAIMLEKVNIRKEIINKKIINLEESVSLKDSIDVDKIQHDINCINKQLEVARKTYVSHCDD